MMYFLSNWIVIIFEFGGIGYALYLLAKIRRVKTEHITVNVKALRNAICLLFPFIVFTTIGLTDIVQQSFSWRHYPTIPVFVVNLLSGLFFVGFLVSLKRAIIFESKEETQSK